MIRHSKYLYIGEVPVAPKPGGALLLHRSFDYIGIKTDKIYVNLDYDEDDSIDSYYYHLFTRLNTTRFSSYYAYLNLKVLWLFLFFKLIFKLRSYDTVYTVSHGVTYKVVYNICKIWKKKLVVFHHDLYTKTINISPKRETQIAQWFVKSIKKDFVRNLYVSPYMKELYNVEGKVLYPTRTKMIAENNHPQIAFTNHNMYYAGSVHSKSNYEAILNVATYLFQIGGKLHLYSNVSKDSFKSLFPTLPSNIEFNDFVEQDKLREILYNKANSLLLVQNFEHSEKIAQMVNFPSKLTDYTLVGVPIVILAPKYASSAQWFSELNVKIGIHVDSYSIDQLKKELDDFFFSDELHKIYGMNAQGEGKKYFGIEAYHAIFKEMA